MTDGALILVAVSVLLLLLVVRVPIAFALAAAGGLGLCLAVGFDQATAFVSRLPYQATSQFVLIVIPLFIAMGVFARSSGVAEALFSSLSRRLERLPGALGLATIGSCAMFAAVSGSSVATVATLGKTSIDGMLKDGYSRSFAAGIIGAGATIGVLIPPSIALILYGIVARESIGAMLIAGFVPGVISTAFYAAYIVLKRMRLFGDASEPRPASAAIDRGHAAGGSGRVDAVMAAPATAAAGGPDQLASSPAAALAAVVVLFAVVIGGMYAGVFTAIEASAVGAFLTLVFFIWRAIASPARSRMSLRIGGQAIRETVGTTAMIFSLFIGASIFTQFLVLLHVPQRLASWALGLPIPPSLTVAILLLAFVPMGMILDPTSMLLIGVPLVHPVATALGYDGIWLGIIVVKLIEVALITPPVGLNVFVVAGSHPGVTVEDAFRGIAPFAVIDLLIIALLFAFPALVTFIL